MKAPRVHVLAPGEIWRLPERRRRRRPLPSRVLRAVGAVLLLPISLLILAVGLLARIGLAWHDDRKGR